MIHFDQLFISLNSNYIDYNNKIVQQIDTKKLIGNYRIEVTFKSSNSIYPQGVVLKFHGGVVEYYNEIYDVRKKRGGLAFRLHYIANKTEIFIAKDVKEIDIWNTWEDGYMRSRVLNAAMIVEHQEFGEVYYCNDGELDEDFDDIIFSIKYIRL